LIRTRQAFTLFPVVPGFVVDRRRDVPIEVVD